MVTFAPEVFDALFQFCDEDTLILFIHTGKASAAQATKARFVLRKKQRDEWELGAARRKAHEDAMYKLACSDPDDDAERDHWGEQRG